MNVMTVRCGQPVRCWKATRGSGLLAVCLTLAWAAVAIGCSSTPRSDGPRRPTYAAPLASSPQLPEGQLLPTEPRIDAVIGRPLIIPVRVVEGSKITPGNYAAKLDDGRPVRARFFRVRVEPSIAPTWLPGTGPWTISDDASRPEVSPGGARIDALWISTPLDAVGQGIWIGQERLDVRWLPFPQRLGKGLKNRRLDLGRRAVKLASEPQTRALLGPESLNPLRRWRARLASVGLDIPSEPGADQPASGDLLADPVLEDWANLVQERWLIGLLRLRDVDSPLAEDVIEALTATATASSVGRVPVWPCDPADLDRLLGLLLSGEKPGPRELEQIRRWERERPGAAAWVSDDAGSIDLATGVPVPAVGFLNLSPSRALAWVSVGNLASEADLKPVEAWSFSRVDIRPDAMTLAGGDAGAAVKATLHLSNWSRPDVLAPTPLPVPVAGRRLGPFLPDWTLLTLLAGSPPAADPAWNGAALLYRDAEAGGPADSGWSIYVECATPGPPDPAERVSVFLGPTVSPRAVLELRPSVGTSGGAQERWTARARIPAQAIEAGGVVRLALFRVDALGRRTSFPRPLLPWDSTPGRVTFRLDRSVPGSSP